MGETLKEKIEKEFRESIKKKDFFCLNFLRLIKNLVKNKEIELKRELKDEEIQEVLFSELKRLKEAKEKFEQGKREDLIKKTEKEIEILKKFLPKELSPQEIEKFAKKIIEKLGVKSEKEMGKVMKELMEKLKGKAEGKLVSEIVKKLLKEKTG